MKTLRIFAAVGLAAVLTGCATFYKQSAEAPSAKLNTTGSAGVKWVCIAGQRQHLQPDASGYADIPAGQRVTIGSMYHNSVYGGVSTSCNPRSSIIPEAGQRYYIDFQIEAERCTAFIFKEDPKHRTGLALDPTWGTSVECAGR
jgi:hypothetical protein